VRRLAHHKVAATFTMRGLCRSAWVMWLPPHAVAPKPALVGVVNSRMLQRPAVWPHPNPCLYRADRCSHLPYLRPYQGLDPGLGLDRDQGLDQGLDLGQDSD
jgi:hypothetical protein